MFKKTIENCFKLEYFNGTRTPLTITLGWAYYTAMSKTGCYDIYIKLIYGFKLKCFNIFQA